MLSWKMMTIFLEKKREMKNVFAFFFSSSISKWSNTCPSTSFQQTCGRKSTITTSTATKEKSLMRKTSWVNSMTHSKRWNNSQKLFSSATFIILQNFHSNALSLFLERVKKHTLTGWCHTVLVWEHEIHPFFLNISSDFVFGIFYLGAAP